MKMVWNQSESISDPQILTSAIADPNAFNLQLSTSCVEGQRDGWSFDHRSLVQTAQRHLGPVPERTAVLKHWTIGIRWHPYVQTYVIRAV